MTKPDRFRWLRLLILFSSKRVRSPLSAVSVLVSTLLGFAHRRILKPSSPIETRSSTFVVSRLFDFWKTCVPVTCVSGFISRLFPESSGNRVKQLINNWTKATLEELEPFEARELAAFVLPNEYLSLSGAAGRSILLNFLSYEGGVDERTNTGAPELDDTRTGANDDENSNSLADFRDVEAAQVLVSGKKVTEKKNTKNKTKDGLRSKKGASDPADNSSDDSLDDDDFAKYCVFRQNFGRSSATKVERGLPISSNHMCYRYRGRPIFTRFSDIFAPGCSALVLSAV